MVLFGGWADELAFLKVTILKQLTGGVPFCTSFPPFLISKITG